MKRYLFRVFYLGGKYFGYQRQLNGKTIENYLELAFIKTRYIHSFQESNYRATSRTDTGVNAIGNTFVLDLPISPNIDYINDHLPEDIILLTFAEVDNDFNPRHNESKIYSYYIPRDLKVYGIERLTDFKGRHDFSQFIKADGAGHENPVNTVMDVEIIEEEKYYKVTITGNRFGREQIRRMIGFVLQNKYKDSNPIEFLRSSNSHDIRSAPATYLVLEYISYDIQVNWIKSGHLLHIFEKGVYKLNKTNNSTGIALKMFRTLINQVN